MTLATNAARDFDLNVEKVLETWRPAHAVREFIANALDEHILTGTKPPEVLRLCAGVWLIRDFGRGLRYEHLTQNENPEKHRHADKVIGRFGVGLKDALAVLHRRGTLVEISSPHGVITLSHQAKSGFADVSTLHARVAPARSAESRGTEVLLEGIADEEVELAKKFFLAFSDERVLERTEYGDIFASDSGSDGRIFVNGMEVAREENFAFSYNVTKLTEVMRRALNRERTHVSRSAYRERVKDILLAAKSEDVARVLADDLQRLTAGDNRDETKWIDVQLHACRILGASRSVVFVTPSELLEQRRFVDYAQQDAQQIVIVPDSIARQLGSMLDLHGKPLQSLHTFAEDWHHRFEYAFVDEADLTASEKAVFCLRQSLLDAAGGHSIGIRAVLISTTIQPSLTYGDSALGVWNAKTRTIVVRRDSLESRQRFAAVLLHEVAHAISGATDVTMAFELALTELLGNISVALLDGTVAPLPEADRLPVRSNQSAIAPAVAGVSEFKDCETCGNSESLHWDEGATAGALARAECAVAVGMLNQRYPAWRFVHAPCGGVIPRLALRVLRSENVSAYALQPWDWHQRLRGQEAELWNRQTVGRYAGELAVMRLLRVVDADAGLATVCTQERDTGSDSAVTYNPTARQCDNFDGSVVSPACRGSPPVYRVRVVREGRRALTGHACFLCTVCAASLETWALERFMLSEKSALRE